jgi:signal peptidase I
LSKRESKKSEKAKAKKGINTLPLYVALVALFILFIFYQSNASLSVIFGIALFMIIVILIVLEVVNGINEEGYKKNILEIAVAIIIVVAFWFSLKALLHTSYPLDVVPSCSMLPILHRGDLILISGITNPSKINAKMINVSNSTYTNFINNIQNEFLSCVAYQQVGNRLTVSYTDYPGYSIGLFRSTSSGGEIVSNSSQQGNLVQYSCGTANLIYKNGTVLQEAYTKSITVNGTLIYSNKNNSVVVYATIPQDYFYQLGDGYIVHRAYAVINASGNYYVLTKGDNNPGLDLQYGNYPAKLNQIQGKVLYSIPYLGYLKLVLSNSFSEPSGCNSTLSD